LTLVLVLHDRLLEGVVDFADAVTEDVGETEQDRQLDAAGLQLVHDLLEVDRLVGAFAGVDGDVAGLVDSEVPLAPQADAVRLQGVLNLPFFHQFRFSAFRHLVSLQGGGCAAGGNGCDRSAAGTGRRRSGVGRRLAALQTGKGPGAMRGAT